ncbi:MAG: thioredoxin family protein [Thermoguttaceae bacterium]
MKIQILGTGCAKCTKLAALAEEAAKQSGHEYTLEKVTDIGQITALGVMVTPAMLVDGKLKCSGTVPNVAQLVAMLKS